MHWRDAISEGFPSPHDREPVSLRSDIADELADHLACSLNRELLRTPDETAASRAVLDRFGDPKQIARRLWWDAMKEIIMKDRVFTAVFVLASLALVAAFVVPWASQQNRVNEAILQQLQSLATQDEKSSALENWSRLTVRVVEESPTGPPVRGVFIDLEGRPFQDVSLDKLTEQTNERGEASFGPLRPGAYRLIASDQTFLPHIVSGSSPTLYAGQEKQVRLIIPSRSSMTNLSFNLQVPEELRESPCVVRFHLQAGKIVRGDTLWGTESQLIAVELKTGLRTDPNYLCEPVSQETLNLKWLMTSYKIDRIELFCPQPPELSEQRQRAQPQQPAQPQSPPVRLPQPQDAQRADGQIRCQPLTRIAEQGLEIEFQPSDENNAWKIQLPDEFISAYQKIMQEPVPVSFQLKPELSLAPGSPRLLLAMRFRLDTIAPASAPSSDLEGDLFVLLDADGKIVPKQIRIGDQPGSLSFGPDPSQASSVTFPVGRYRVDRIVPLVHTDNTVNECLRFAWDTPGLSNLKFTTEPNQLNTWMLDLPEAVLRGIEKCAVTATQPQ